MNLPAKTTADPQWKKTIQYVVIAIILGIALYNTWQQNRTPVAQRDARPNTAPESIEPQHNDRDSAEPSRRTSPVDIKPNLDLTPLDSPRPEESTKKTPVEVEKAAPDKATKQPVPAKVGQQTPVAPPVKKTPVAPAKPKLRLRIDNQTIRDLEGEVAYQGTVDLTATVARIQRGEELDRFRHDGITFENREQRLPQREAGYYREWVHPTPDVSGPGPQRVISGRPGEFWYTPNHYRTFIKLHE
jgi:guanyl-specific ribonuclease Sa